MVRGKVLSVSHQTDEERPYFVCVKWPRCSFWLRFPVCRGQFWTRAQRKRTEGKLNTHRLTHTTPVNAPANFSIVWRIHSNFLPYFVSRRERRNWKSSLCHKEDLPSAWIRYQVFEVTMYLCTSQWMTVALMPFQTDVKGAYGQTPSKGSKVASLHAFQCLHTFNTFGSVMVWLLPNLSLLGWCFWGCGPTESTITFS